MSGYFLSRNTPWLKDGCTWAMHRGVHEVHSQTYHILSTDSYLLQNVVVQGTRHNTDHYLVLGCLLGAAPAAHLR